MTQSPAVADVLRIVADALDVSLDEGGNPMSVLMGLRDKLKRLAAQTATPAAVDHAPSCAVNRMRQDYLTAICDCSPTVSPAPAETECEHEWAALNNAGLRRCTLNGGCGASKDEYSGKIFEIAGTSRPNEPERADDSGGAVTSTQHGTPLSEAGLSDPEDRPDTPIGADVRIAAGRRTSLSTGDAGANLLTQLSESYGDRGTAGVHAASPVLSPLATPEGAGELRACPFCKSAAIEHAEIPISEDIACPAHVQCQSCGAMAPATVWNARPSEDVEPVPSDDAIHESIEALAEWADQEPDITGYGGKLLKDAVTNMRAVMAELSRLRRTQGRACRRGKGWVRNERRD